MIFDKFKSKNAEMKNIKTKESQDKFIMSFCNVIKNGIVDEFDEYLTTFRLIVEYSWNSRLDDNTSYSLEALKRNFQILVDTGISTDNKNGKLMTLKLYESAYEVIASIIKEKGIKRESKKDVLRKSFCLIYSSDFFDVIRALDIAIVENQINISRLLYNANLVDMARFYDGCQDQDDWGATTAVNDIQANLGLYLSEQKRRGNNPSISYWSNEFTLWIGAEKETVISEELQDLFTTAVANAGIMYICGLISAGCLDVLEEGFYNRRLLNNSLIGIVEQRVVITVHAFLYYMIFVEDERYVGEDLRKKTIDFWNEHREIYNGFMTNFADKVIELLKSNLNAEWHIKEIDGHKVRIPDLKSQWIYYLLRRFDFRTRSRRQIGVLILPEAIDDYCMFSIAYLSRYRFADSKYTWINDADHDIGDFTKYINTSNIKLVKKQLKGYIDFVIGDGEYNEEQREITSVYWTIYKQLTVGIRDLYKERKSCEARELEARYLLDKNELSDRIAEWTTSISKAIKDSFGEDIDTNGNYNNLTFHSISLLHYTTMTDAVKDAINESFIHGIIATLIDGYIAILADGSWIVRKEREDFHDDVKYINFLVEHNIGWMIGSEYILKNKDYMMTEKFKQATNGFKWICSVGCLRGMGVKRDSVRFYIRKIKIDINDSDMKNERINGANAEGDYFFEPVHNIPIKFDEKDELEEFIKQSRKVVEVTAEIAVNVASDNAIGFYIDYETRIPCSASK